MKRYYPGREGKPVIVMVNGWWQLKIVPYWMNSNEADKARAFCAELNFKRQHLMFHNRLPEWYP